MNGANGYSPSYGAPPPPPPGYGVPASQPPAAYGAPAPGVSAYGAYGAPPPQQQQQQQPAYGAPPQPYAGYAQQPAPSYGPPGVQYPQQGMNMNMGAGVAPKNPGLAVALELLGGFFLQTFGVGHLYSGNVGMGLGLMFGYWALTAVNIVLCFLFIGFITWPLTWLAFMILSAITANGAAKKANAKAGFGPAY
jgi:TM2 domain-containing membrane protein YozV